MGSDMIVALKEASAHQTVLFGLNHRADKATRLAVQVVPAMMHDPGEVADTLTARVPQARQTFAVLGVQQVGAWGFVHGVNEHRVAIGVTQWKSRRPAGRAALSGPDFVRLALERGRSAYHAVEALTDLLEHFGESAESGANDHIFLIADASEAFALEASGRYWALLECGPTRVVTDAAMIRQDWRRLAPGLADFAVERGWWQDDGSKVDFVRCLGTTHSQARNAQKRWGRASLALAQQQGAIDLYFLRRMLAEHDANNRDLFAQPDTCSLADSFLVDLQANDQPVVAWIAFGDPAVAVYFPLCLAGEIPGAFVDALPAAPTIQDRVKELEQAMRGSPRERVRLMTALEHLQTKFDIDTDEFLAKAHDYRCHGKPHLVRQLATEMMHAHVDAFAKEHQRLLGIEEKTPARQPVVEEVMFYA